eukprot:1266591-Rhodomonas_salina.4
MPKDLEEGRLLRVLVPQELVQRYIRCNVKPRILRLEAGQTEQCDRMVPEERVETEIKRLQSEPGQQKDSGYMRVF